MCETAFMPAPDKSAAQASRLGGGEAARTDRMGEHGCAIPVASKGGSAGRKFRAAAGHAKAPPCRHPRRHGARQGAGMDRGAACRTSRRPARPGAGGPSRRTCAMVGAARPRGTGRCAINGAAARGAGIGR